MENEHLNRNSSQNPDPQKDGLLEGDITHPQESQTLSDWLPMSLVEWLARINQRHQILRQDKPNDTC